MGIDCDENGKLGAVTVGGATILDGSSVAEGMAEAQNR
jgi:hypothetical protein